MRRREWMKTVGAVAAASAWPLDPAGAQPAGAGGAMLETEIVRLNLRHTWTTTMSSSEYRDTLHVRLTRDGLTATGEGAPIVRYKENAESARRAVESVADLLTSANLLHFDKVLAQAFGRIEGEWAAKSAIDIAVMDWVGQKLGVPVHRLFGLDAADAPVTTFSIGIDTPEVTRQKTREAEAYPVLKVKVGLDTDEATIEAVRSVTRKPLRVDANEGWKDKEVARQKIKWLETQGVEFIEQPLPAAMHDEQKWLRSQVDMPIFADEACLRAADIPKLAEAYDGVNIKLDKVGGIQQAYRAIVMARALGMKVMLGCMISSSATITAAAQLSPLVDYADLDGHLLIANDPYVGVTVEGGRLVLPTGPGLGLKRR
ncbi:MAG: dipeptide epimerase [Vicinamibacterales bacterium]|nr:dipeptide epimerase [Vicinamibacterales bacterium]